MGLLCLSITREEVDDRNSFKDRQHQGGGEMLPVLGSVRLQLGGESRTVKTI